MHKSRRFCEPLSLCLSLSFTETARKPRCFRWWSGVAYKSGIATICEDQRDPKAFHGPAYLSRSAARRSRADKRQRRRWPPPISRALLTRVHRLRSVYVQPRVNREQLVRRMRQSGAPGRQIRPRNLFNERYDAGCCCQKRSDVKNPKIRAAVSLSAECKTVAFHRKRLFSKKEIRV